MNTIIALVLVLVTVLFFSCTQGQTTYIIGPQGESCSDACFARGLNCNPHIITNNTQELFIKLGVNCNADSQPWWAEDQPAFITLKTDPNYGKCLGYINLPGGVQCGAKFPASSRLCRCDDPNSFSPVGTFGTGLSNSFVDQVERTLFTWILPRDTTGVMTHFWLTAGHPVSAQTMIRYYIDGETNASIAYYPPLACGSGFDDQTAPWGTEWFGRGAADGAWFNNFKIPFQRSVRVTYQRNVNGAANFYIMVRGAPIPASQKTVSIGPNLDFPTNARLRLFTFDQVVQPLAWVNLVDLPSGSGLMFMHTLSVISGTMNFLEGCYHAYTPYNQEFPGTVLSTGTEDYFDSAWYFNAGQFRLPVSGFTHLDKDTSGKINWSAYRFHVTDPLRFQNGFKFVWRNGDSVDATGQKCYMETGGATVGNPTASTIMAYAWVYTW